MQTLSQDLRYGLRVLLKSPGSTLIAILTLALGIGANAAIFSVINAVLLRPLPYRQPEQLVRVFTENPVRGWDQSQVSLYDFRDWQQQNHVFAHLAAYNPGSINLSGGTQPERVDYARVTADFFSVLGAEPLLGRAFHAEDDQPGKGNVVVLSYGFWQRHFGGNPETIGSSLLINGENSTIIGVMPPQVQYPDQQTELWTPIAMTPESTGDRAGRWLDVIARLQPYTSRAQAQSEMELIARNLAAQYPESNRDWTVMLTPLQEQQTAEVRPALYLLWGAVGLVLLIACANIASLLLARATRREKEIAVRLALGAGRARIIRQLLTESLLLALAGAAAGVLLAWWGVELLTRLSVGETVTAVGIDRTVLLYSLGLALLTGIMFGLVPALKASATGLNETLKDGGRGFTGAARHRTRNLLVIGEIALTLILLVGAGLLLRSFAAVLKVDPGFDTQNLLTLRMAPPQAQFQDDEASREDALARYRNERQRMVRFYQAVEERVKALPGVEAAGVVNVRPLTGNRWVTGFNIEGREMQTRAEQPTALSRVVSPGYLNAMRIPLLVGRALADSDQKETVPVAVVSQTMARRHWPNENPVGRRIRFGEDPAIFAWVTIVGVVGDAHLNAIEVEPDAAIYIPFSQAIFGHFGDWGMTMAVRSERDPEQMVSAIRAEVQALDSTLPLYEISTMQQILEQSSAQRRSHMLLLGLFAALALTLAIVGVYGVISYSQHCRQKSGG